MYKNKSYKEKFVDLAPWFSGIVHNVKKEIRSEHLKKSPSFTKQYFSQANPQKLTSEELAKGYLRAIEAEENGEDIAEFIASRWLMKQSEIYHEFEKELGKIASDFSELESIDKEFADQLCGQFGPQDVYIFSVLNSVVFPDETFGSLREKALEACKAAEKNFEDERRSAEVQKEARNYQLEMARLVDRYEKKLSGLQKKYVADTDALKKQIAALQRSLQSKNG